MPVPAAPFDIVVPTLGRPSLRTLLTALGASRGVPPGRIIVVEDRDESGDPLDTTQLPRRIAGLVDVLPGPAAGPAAARNAGWRASRAEWVAFLDDDVVPSRDWLTALAADLASADDAVGGVQGRIVVPLAVDRRPTDWERNVKVLEGAAWATADMAYRREALAGVGGFDERFRRAYREDTDLALRLEAAGWRLTRGTRVTVHPVGPARRWVSVRAQAGNADDVLLWALHGRAWRRRSGAGRGRAGRHFATVAGAAGALVLAAAGRRRAAGVSAAIWLAGTAELAWARIAPGPRDPAEVGTMLATSVVLPWAAVAYRALGLARLPRLLRPSADGARGATPGAVLLDRDGTLVVDVPYNGDPGRVELMPGAREAVDRLRRAGVPTAVVSNQSGIGRGLVTRDQVEAVNRRVEELLGPLGPWALCPHLPDDGCACRKPAPGLLLEAARALGVEPSRCAVVGDVGSDVAAALAVGARPVLVPTARTRAVDVASAPEVAPDLPSAVERLLAGTR